ncbi:MAG: hypothetical protein AAGK04_07465 [Planctomycetota bacterium]
MTTLAPQHDLGLAAETTLARVRWAVAKAEAARAGARVAQADADARLNITITPDALRAAWTHSGQPAGAFELALDAATIARAADADGYVSLDVPGVILITVNAEGSGSSYVRAPMLSRLGLPGGSYRLESAMIE